MGFLTALLFFFLGIAYSQPPFMPPGHMGNMYPQPPPAELTRLDNPPFTLIVLPRAISWAQAVDVCRSNGMRIASIHSLDENMKILSLLRGVVWQSGVWHGAWIGLTDEGSEGNWRWVDGTPLDYVNFGPGEPNGGTSENYGAIELARAGRPDGWWNDANMNESYAAVVCRAGAVAKAPTDRNSVASAPSTKTQAPPPPPTPAVTPPPMPRTQLPPPVIKTQTGKTTGRTKCIESVGVGEASVIGGDRASAKMEALARAKWDAIEKALGVTTSVKTIVQNFRLLDEVIKNEVGGFIRNLKVLKEENFADMVRVKVKGCVYPKEAEKALSFISRDTAFSVIIVTKKPDVVELDEMNPVTTELVNILNQQGFKVYDFAGNPNVNPYDIENIIAQRRFIALRAYMSRVLSGAMVVGKVELIPSTKTGQDIGYGIRATFNVVTARLNYYLLARDNQGLRIVASGSLSALGRAPNLRDAQYRAMEALAKRLGSDIMGKLEKYMASKRKVVTVVVRGVRSTRQNFAIKDKLQRVPWVQSVEDLGLGKFRVNYLENTIYLANAIERMPELKLIRFSPTEVEAELL